MWPSAVQRAQAGHRPYSHFLKTTWSTISLVKPFTLCRIWLPAFQGSSIIPRVLLQGQRLTEVFTCLKMYQAINRSYFPSILWYWVYSFLFLFLPHLSAFIKKKGSKGEKNNPPTKQFQIGRKNIHLASQKIDGRAPGPQKKETAKNHTAFPRNKVRNECSNVRKRVFCIRDGCLWEFWGASNWFWNQLVTHLLGS